MKAFVHVMAGGMLLLAGAAQAADSIVPIEEEPQHRLKFQNQHVRLFDVLLPPGYNGLWHFHVNDGVFVNIEPAPTSEHVLGSEAASRPPRMIGETYFFGYASKPKVHRVDNIGESTFHVVDTEIVRACGGFTQVKDGDAQTLILENERVRVTRLMLAPGERVSLHPPCGMLVSVSGGRLSINSPGAEQQVSLNPAGFTWRDQTKPLDIVNVGNEVFHAVDVVVK
jgi:hypothetical protein